MINNDQDHDQPQSTVSRRRLLAGGATTVGTVAAASVLGGSVLGGLDTPVAAAAPSRRSAVSVSAPDGSVVVGLALDGSGRPSWSITVHGRQVLAPSPLGFALDDGTDFTTGLKLTDVDEAVNADQNYRLTQGKFSAVHTRAATRTVTLRNAHGKRLQIDLWASTQGGAVRYRSDAGHQHRLVTAEATGLSVRVPADGGTQFAQPYTRTVPKYQEFYLQRDDHRIAKLGETVRSALDDTDGIGFPIMLRTADHQGDSWWLLAGESGFDGTYAGCHLGQPVVDQAAGTVTYPIAFPTDDEALGTFGPGAPQVSGRWQSPWRYVAVGREVTDVAATTLSTDLAAPATITDTRWIKPGGASFGWLTDHSSPSSLERTLPFFDLSAKLGWPYSLVDATWDTMTDATGAAVDLDRLVAEADQRGIKLFLWYNSGGPNNTSASPRDKLYDPIIRRQELARLQAAGVAGLKIDGWQSDKQQLLAYQRDVLEDAAKYQLLVVLHNSTVPRGWDRTYPHLMGYESGIASEYYANSRAYSDQMPEQATIAAVLRNAVGPFDYGTTIFRDEVTAGSRRLTSNAHELALTVIYQSGFNGYADGPDQYLGQSQGVRDVLRTVPLAWDETRFLAADPGRMVVVARRKGRTWWVAGINGLTESISATAVPTDPGYAPATGTSLELVADLDSLGVSKNARITLFGDTSPTDNTLAQTQTRGNLIQFKTAPFGGFLAIVS